MKTQRMTPFEIQSRGFAALARELGPTEYVRFLQQIMSGRGDYSRDRHQHVDKLKLDDIRAGIEALGGAAKRKKPKKS